LQSSSFAAIAAAWNGREVPLGGISFVGQTLLMIIPAGMLLLDRQARRKRLLPPLAPVA
jgi:hypothetical protein